MATRHLRHTLIAALALAGISGCKAPSINLATNQPIKVDIAMRLDVYQHNEDGVSPTATPKPAATPKPDATSKPDAAVSMKTEPGKRSKDREADIQVFKNSRLVGEGHDGLLVILQTPEDKDADYVRHMVAAENADRISEMKAYAKAQKLSLAEVQAARGELWQKRSFKGEWIEVKSVDGSYQWLQKQG